MAAFWKLLNRTPPELRKFMAKGITSAAPHAWDRIAGALGRLAPPVQRLSSPGNKLHKAAEALASASPDGFYRGVLSIWHDPGSIVVGGSEPPTLLQQSGALPSGLDPMQRMMALDTLCYLPDDILAKVDRAAMAVSLETRAPFLDQRVLEFAWRLPQSMKWRDGQAKWVLRQLLYRYVPRHLVERPKMGFAVPVGAWLKGALRDWGEDLLDPARLRNEGYFDPGSVRRKWEEHLTGRRNWEYQLWAVLMFQAWLAAQSALPVAEEGCRIAREA
jgi:asparagine synthase (glutamine-hydrolysing)